MRILALDTSTEFLSLACLEDGEVVCSVHEKAGIKHSEILVSRIQSILEKSNWKKEDIDLIAMGLGPGSFTGLRIGVATVKGLALVLGVKLIGIPSMDAIAERKSLYKGLIVPVLDAHKGNVYSCVYKKDVSNKTERKTDYLLCKIGELQNIVKGKAVFYGNGLEKYRGEIEKWPLAEIDETSDWHPRAEDIGRMGYELADSPTVLPEDLEPMYLYSRECNVTKRDSEENR